MTTYREWARNRPKNMAPEDELLVLGWGLVVFMFIWPFKLAWWLVSKPAGLASLAGFVATGLLIGFANAWALVQWIVLLVPLAMGGWWLIRRDSFREHAAWRLKAHWRYRRVYRRKWKEVMENGGFKKAIPLARDRMPRIVKFRCTPTVDRLLIEPNNCDIEDFRDTAPHIGRAFNARRCTVRRDRRHDRLWLEFLVTDCLSEIIPPLVPAKIPDLSAVPCGRREDGSDWTIKLTGTHTFMGGQTRAGKSSVLGALLLALGPAIRDGLVEVWAWDPKGGMELDKYWAEGKGLFARYQDDTMEGMVQQLRDLEAFMEARSRRLKDLGIDKHVPSAGDPFVLAIIDEAADMVTTREMGGEDGKQSLKAEVISLSERILRKGTANSIHLLFASQEPRKEKFPQRDLFPDGIALSLKRKVEVDMVLGPDASATGADCVGLELPRDAGRGFEIRDGSPHEFRASLIDREMVREMCELYAPRKAESLEDELERMAT